MGSKLQADYPGLADPVETIHVARLNGQARIAPPRGSFGAQHRPRSTKRAPIGSAPTISPNASSARSNLTATLPHARVGP